MKVAAIQVVIFLIGLATIEVILELLAPLPAPGGFYVDRDGHPARVAQDELSLRPNLDLFHKGAEFTAKIRTNGLGNRIIDNESRQVDFLWLGDSFTFGHGVSDEQTFPFIVCTRNHFVCANLGHSGAETFQEVNILSRAITKEKYQTKNVVVVMLTACWLDQAGNDLGDNLKYYRDHVVTSRQPDEDISRGGLLKRLQGAIGKYEIVKRSMLIFSAWIKRGTYKCSASDQIGQALDATKNALEKLERLARESAFNVTVVEIHPYQELDGAFRKTEALVSGIIPKSIKHIPTGQFFTVNDYYHYDGHFNALGHARLATVIEQQLKR
jgi:hypothetical protein